MQSLIRSSHIRAALVVVSFAALVAAASCSTDASTRAAASVQDEPEAEQVTELPQVPEGTVLRVGDQLDYLKTVLEVSGQSEDLPYEVEYANFVGGPPMLQAFQGGALDTGFVASTPIIFAQAAGQDLKAVLGWAPEVGLGGLISADPAIEDWDDLEGKKVAYQRGTSAEAAVLTGLERAGLSAEDITTVDVPITQVSSAITSGSADAGLSSEPLISLFLADTPDGHVVASADDITDRGSFLIASGETLADEARSAALADFVTRLVKGFTWLSANREALADSVFAEQYKLPPERALELAESAGEYSFLALPGEIAEPQQELADRFHAAGQIPAEIDTSSEFDGRFNDLIAQTAEDAQAAEDAQKSENEAAQNGNGEP